MKNITLSADEDVIELARSVARSQKKTLNQAFREWLSVYTGQRASMKEYQRLMKDLQYVKAGRKFSRDEMNER